MRPDCGSSKKTLISLEQVELVKLMKELEESVTAVKGQINALSVSCTQLGTFSIISSFCILLPGRNPSSEVPDDHAE